MDSKNKKKLNFIITLIAIDSCIWSVLLVYLTFYNQNMIIRMSPFIFVITKAIIFRIINKIKSSCNE